LLIDIVVPIYNAYHALSNCLKSLQKHQSIANKIWLINDASTDGRIIGLINRYALTNNWTVINHNQNLGFVKTANEGLKLSNNHTILLNSDTIVSEYWLIAFQQALNKNQNIGTLTTWSNNAEICSFPNFLKNNNPPEYVDVLSNLIFNHYCAKYPNIPTAVGFCMLISQQAKIQVGYFDENHFGHGYGEENDYSLRVEKEGLKNVLCDNAYVVHIGNESFNEFGLQPNEQTMQRLLQKHPNYINNIQNFIEKDTLAINRQEILSIIKNNNIQMYNELIKND